MNPHSPSLARHTVRGSAYSVASSAGTLALGILRTYLMVTLLLPEQIGQAALGLFYTGLALQLGGLGLTSAFIHWQQPGEAGRRTFYSFHVLTGGASLLLAAASAPLIARFYPAYPDLQPIIWAYAAITMLRVANQPQVSVLEKELSFGRLALVDLAGALASTVAGPGMAYLGFGVWAVLGDYAGGVLARSLLLHLWLRPFRPRFGWDRRAASWLWGYAKNVWLSANLTFLIDNFDDFWVGTRLGKGPLGLYSKAYEFSRYPRRVVANPILAVFFPTFAHLQGERQRLSRAFFRATSLIVRAGALFSLLAVLAAPEVFRLLLPEAWAPMRLTFQLMVVYTFLDPLGMAAQRLLLATGHPGAVSRTRVVQLLAFVPAVVVGASLGGIEGVALAADLMILVGGVLLFRYTRRVVDYSPAALWLWPAVALTGIGGTVLGIQPFLEGGSDIAVLAGKLLLVPLFYAGVLWLFEKEQLKSGLDMVMKSMRSLKANGSDETQSH